MKKINKILALCLALTLCLNFGTMVSSATAEDFSLLAEEKMTALGNALGSFEAQKNIVGLEDVDFSALQLGKPIQTYVYINETFEPGDVLYPIINGTDLVLWAIDLDGQFQITTALVDELNSLVDVGTSIAIIYDRSSSYLYMNGRFTLLKTSTLDDPSRSVFDPSKPHDYNMLQTTTLIGLKKLPHKAYGARAQRYFSCNVEKVLQAPYDNLCWAAVTACISNYVKGTSLTTDRVAQIFKKSMVQFNFGIGAEEIQSLMDEFNLPYTFDVLVPSDNQILTNIKNDRPIYSIWTYGHGNSHACCIYAIDIMNGYIYVMDPWDGFISVPRPSNGGVYNYRTAKGSLTLAAAACSSWS